MKSTNVVAWLVLHYAHGDNSYLLSEIFSPVNCGSIPQHAIGNVSQTSRFVKLK
ncbi:hypothetical protein [Fructilactobacillus lindneri]|uniref:hypothetical protein n=1 Tax=Fructilactobacillus lindneri TaxID=53444 RepID=UPI0015E17399|nr:hypothetical protein [Fructilactobacillus lindneri]